MAMTKKEREEHEKALKQARVLGALRWTSPVEPDVSPPDSGTNLSTGWVPRWISADGYVGAEVACSSSVFHARGRTDKTTSQNPIWMYSTKLLALKAQRHEAEKTFAEKLARIDAEIAIEESK